MTKPTTLQTRLNKISTNDVTCLLAAQVFYGDSWKRRGGMGAFMMLARKWDRIENQVLPDYDVFAAYIRDNRQEGILDDIRDLRRYLMLVESELLGTALDEPTSNAA